MDEILVFDDLKIDTGTHQVWRGEREIYLSKTEYKMLMEFIKHPRHVMTKQVLFQSVWEKDEMKNSNIVEVYIRYLRQKLELFGEKRLIFTVHGYGYVLR